MMDAIHWLIIAFATGLTVPLLAFATQVSASLLGNNSVDDDPAAMTSQPRPSISVVIPAHNEGASIAATLESVLAQTQAGDRMIVVADNCTDDTAQVASRSGAEVVVRSDSQCHGKGYALDFGVKHLRDTGKSDVVFFLDADCRLGENCLKATSALAVTTGRPVQALYLMNMSATGNATARIVCFAWTIKNLVRPLGWHRLGFPCLLTGSGMVLPWTSTELIDLASGSIAEDLKLGLDLALAGKLPLLCPTAIVTSNVTGVWGPSQSQRARWEHGTLEVTLGYLPKLVWSACRRWDANLLAIALDTSIPPLALFFLELMGLLVTALLWNLLVSDMGVVLTALTLNAVFLASVLLAWWGHGRRIVPFRTLLSVPLYAALKLPLYLGFLLRRHRQWSRGERQP